MYEQGRARSVKALAVLLAMGSSTSFAGHKDSAQVHCRKGECERKGVRLHNKRVNCEIKGSLLLIATLNNKPESKVSTAMAIDSRIFSVFIIFQIDFSFLFFFLCSTFFALHRAGGKGFSSSPLGGFFP
jgi:hypothetical protein